MTDARGFREDGTHEDTKVARDTHGFNAEGQHISQSTHMRGLRQPRETNGQFAEKQGTEAEITLSSEPTEDPVVGILGETPSQYARRNARLDSLIRRELHIDDETTTSDYLRDSDIDATTAFALMHSAVEQEKEADTFSSFPEVDALYAKAHEAEKKLVDQGVRSILDEYRPGTKSALVTTWSGSGDVDLIAFENEDGTIDAAYDSVPAVSAFYGNNLKRFARLIESRVVPRVETEEASDFNNRLVGNRRLHGGNFYRFG